jgi:hypothetical protein
MTLPSVVVTGWACVVLQRAVRVMTFESTAAEGTRPRSPSTVRTLHRWSFSWVTDLCNYDHV